MSSYSEFFNSLNQDLLALIWFAACYMGYQIYAKRRSYQVTCLASVMHLYRREWMNSMLKRDVRVADTTTVANLERGVTFFASTTMLVLAGLMTLLSRSDTAIGMLSELPFSTPMTPLMWDLRIVLLMVIFVYAFFKFTWSLRQYGFVSVMIGGAPNPSEAVDPRSLDMHAERAARMASMAANNFNIGLRTYYFAIAGLSWMVNGWLFMVLTAVVVWILYRREFASSTLRTLMMSTDINSITK
ncbi:MAG: hypothetical protein RL143_1229 [Pseudomonadota bacterium]|jgi:uncharacterized membrane protein